MRSSFEDFLAMPFEYRKKFLQQYYNCGFDGYSYMGQKDSSNQYETDLLHSFVLSEFSAPKKFPNEFHPFLKNEWQLLIEQVRSIELNIIKNLSIPGLEAFYHGAIGHMISCNFYPKVAKSQSINLRLSKHVDVSLFTVFVFGASEGFAFQNLKNETEVLAVTDNIIIFPGYLLEFLTNGKYKALEHQVDFLNPHKERYSFAFFSLPKPNLTLKFMDRTFTSKVYFKNYLSLF
ncbi:2OG-Fe(II) oxygenase family protein [Algibacter mikhailovii]|uniref:2OG-Fe(II) oxygenase family protein n=1 Tax=Algibacter mikhailovii TaxID=425498 RepID=UPI0024951BEA|nr:2OG-Fe(II) oxygenase family protein [Algibacter mikhailovii]